MRVFRAICFSSRISKWYCYCLTALFMWWAASHPFDFISPIVSLNSGDGCAKLPMELFSFSFCAWIAINEMLACSVQTNECGISIKETATAAAHMQRTHSHTIERRRTEMKLNQNDSSLPNAHAICVTTFISVHFFLFSFYLFFSAHFDFDGWCNQKKIVCTSTFA